MFSFHMNDCLILVLEANSEILLNKEMHIKLQGRRNKIGLLGVVFAFFLQMIIMFVDFLCMIVKGSKGWICLSLFLKERTFLKRDGTSCLTLCRFCHHYLVISGKNTFFWVFKVVEEEFFLISATFLHVKYVTKWTVIPDEARSSRWG